MSHFNGRLAWKSSQEKVFKCLMVYENGLGEQLGRATWESSLRGVVNVKNKVKKSIQCVEKLGRVQWKSSLREQFGRAVLKRRERGLEEQPENIVE